MKITKTVKDSTTTYYYDGIKKYTHSKDSDGFERWREYNKNGNEIHYKNSDRYESWNNYDNSGQHIYFRDSDGYEKCRPLEEEEVNQADLKPFKF